MKLLNAIAYMILILPSYSPAAVPKTNSERIVHWGECTAQELKSGYRTGTKWYNGGLAGPTPRTVCFYPSRSLSDAVKATGVNSFANGCFLAKQAFGIPSTLNETDKWSSSSRTNGHDEWSWSALCGKAYSNQRYISLRILQDDEYHGCAVYDVVTKRYNYDFVDRFIQSPQLQFQACLKSVYLKLQVTK